MTKNENLHVACQNQDTELVKKILFEIKPTELNKKIAQETPLQIVCKNGNLEITKLLIEAGADVDAANTFHHIVAINDANLVRVALNAGADVNRVYANIRPLDVVTISNDEILRMLIRAGARVGDLCNLSRTAFFIAFEKGSLAQLRFVLIHAAAHLPEYNYGIFHGQFQAVIDQTLMEIRLYRDRIIQNINNIEVLAQLLTNEEIADCVDARDEDGRTVIDVALAIHGHGEITKLIESKSLFHDPLTKSARK